MFCAKFSYYVDPVVLDKKLYLGKEVQNNRISEKLTFKKRYKKN